MTRTFLTAVTLLIAAPAVARSFVNWESPHVNPIDLTPDGAHLLVVNTADHRLEVFRVTDAGLDPVGSIPVGLDPVSVRARTNSEAWVANHVSDSISIIDLDLMNVRATIEAGDEPTDVIFAGAPERAFITVSQLDQVKVYDPADPAAPPIVLDIDGQDPRAMSTDGSNVYVAIFESGNLTTSLNEQFHVTPPELNPYPDDPNPPPNAGDGFAPPINPDLPGSPPRTGLIVQKQVDGTWRDDNDGDWSAAVTWDLHDHDVAVIDAGALTVRYVTGAMNLNMHLDAGPNGVIAAVGTDAINNTRFEPNVNGVFVRSVIVGFNAQSGSPTAILDLNPHLTYQTSTVPQNVRDLAIGDPRAVRWSGAGDRVYVAGMGSNNVAILDASGVRLALVEVGPGPTGIAVDDARGRLYVLNKFEGSVSIVDPVAREEIERILFYDPTPAVIRAGRPHLYDTHATSGLGHTSCASCHVDGRLDGLVWDLGDPSGEMKAFDEDCRNAGCIDWHPMKGPMSTQTLFGIIDTEPLHWRGDRADFAAFNPAFESVLGDDAQLTEIQMAEFEAFVATLTFPPNPNRDIDNSLKALLSNGGHPRSGEMLFGAGILGAGALGPESMIRHTGGRMRMDGEGNFNCAGCHALPTGTDGRILEPIIIGGLTQNNKTAPLRSVYEKVGFDSDDPAAGPLARGSGLLHGGSFPSLDFFLHFFFDMTAQQALDVEAFLLSFGTDTHAGVGVQATLGDVGDPDPEETALILQMMDGAGADDLGLVVKGRRGGLHRGYVLVNGVFQSDRAAETLAPIDLVDEVGPGAELTFTLVPFGSERRIGIDRDEDGFLDRDEIDQGSDPADPDEVPTCLADIDRDNEVAFPDLIAILAAWGRCDDPGACREDLDQDGAVAFPDLLLLLAAWGACE